MVEAKVHYKHSALAEQVLENIRRGIYPVGSRLPAERDLSERFAVSRNTVREALSGLFADGILERQGRGAYVAEAALQKIEGVSRSGAARVVALISFIMYESPIYRTIFETMRAGLDDRAGLEVCFAEKLPGGFADMVKADDVVLAFGNEYDESAMLTIRSRCRGVILINAQSNVFDYITLDNYNAGRAVAAYLYENGHRRIGAALCLPDYANEFGDRYRGARDFLHEHGLTLLAETVNDRQHEFAIIRDFLTVYRKRQATAMICFKDLTALMLYELARREKLRLPDDMSVVSFDDRCYTGFVHPALSTVRYPAEEVGRAVLEGVNTLLNGEPLNLHRQIMPTLLKRDSVAQIRPGKK